MLGGTGHVDRSDRSDRSDKNVESVESADREENADQEAEEKMKWMIEEQRWRKAGHAKRTISPHC